MFLLFLHGVLLSILFNDFILICMFYTLEWCHLEEVTAEKLMNANISAMKWHSFDENLT
jgi:hypothetical protein